MFSMYFMDLAKFWNIHITLKIIYKISPFLHFYRFVYIQQFEVLYDFSEDIVVSNPYVLNDKDYEKIMQRIRNKKLPSSPGHVMKKMTSRYVDLCKTPKPLRK